MFRVDKEHTVDDIKAFIQEQEVTVTDILCVSNADSYTHSYRVVVQAKNVADAFKQFRSTCMTYYGLDPAHYYTAPGLSWDAMLKMTGVSLELFTDPDMHLLVVQLNLTLLNCNLT